MAVDVLAGGRYVDLDSGITVENALDVDRSQDWLDPFVGGRLTVNLIDRLSVSVRGDIGGFGVGSHFTWNMAAILRYQVSPRVSAGVGYTSWTSITRRAPGPGPFGTTSKCGGPCWASTSTFRGTQWRGQPGREVCRPSTRVRVARSWSCRRSRAVITPYRCSTDRARSPPILTSRMFRASRPARAGNCRRMRSSSMTARSSPGTRRRWRW